MCDGAMGTMLYARGVFVNRCFDELNLSSANLVRAVHEDYLEAGVDVIETNTFGAHRFKLGPHGFEKQVAQDQPRGSAHRQGGGARARPRRRRHRSPGKAPRALRQHRLSRRGRRVPGAGRGPRRRGRRPLHDRDDAVAGDGQGGALRGAIRLGPARGRLPHVQRGGDDVLRGQARGRRRRSRGARRSADRRQLQPGPAADARDGEAHGVRGEDGQAVGDAQRRIARQWSRGATSTSARRSTWPPTRGASSAPASPSSEGAAARRRPTSRDSSGRCGCSSRRGRRSRSCPRLAPRKRPRPSHASRRALSPRSSGRSSSCRSSSIRPRAPTGPA